MLIFIFSLTHLVFLSRLIGAGGSIEVPWEQTEADRNGTRGTQEEPSRPDAQEQRIRRVSNQRALFNLWGQTHYKLLAIIFMFTTYISTSVHLEKWNKIQWLTYFKCKAIFYFSLSLQKCRYETYISLLQAKFRTGSDDLDKIEASLFSVEGKEGHLRKTQSSPSISQGHRVNGRAGHKHAPEHNSWRAFLAAVNFDLMPETSWFGYRRRTRFVK